MSEAEVENEQIEIVTVKQFTKSKKDKSVLLEVYKYGKKTDYNYGIKHVYSNATIFGGYLYKNVATTLAGDLLNILPPEFFTSELVVATGFITQQIKDWLGFYAYTNIKQALGFNDFIHSSDYETYIIERESQRMANESREQEQEELYRSFVSISHVEAPNLEGGLSGRDMEQIICGESLTSTLDDRFNRWHTWFFSIDR